MIASDPAEMFWICLDQLPQVAKGAAHKLDGFLHFSPEVIPSIDEAGELSVMLKSAGPQESQVYRVGFLGVDKWELAKSWYCPQFGMKIENYSVMYSANSNSSTMLGWYICPLDSGSVKISKSNPNAIEVFRFNPPTTSPPSYLELF